MKKKLKKKKNFTLFRICENDIFIALLFFLLTIKALLRLLKKCENLFDSKFKLFFLFVKLLFYANINQ